MISTEQRPSQKIEPSYPRVWIGLDVGGTKIEGVAVDDTGTLRGRVLIPTDARTAEQAVGSIVQALDDLLSQVGPAARMVAAVGLGIPGKVEDGVVSLAVNLRLASYPLADELSQRFGIPVYLENDVRAAALGAYAWVRERRPISQHDLSQPGDRHFSRGDSEWASVPRRGRHGRGSGSRGASTRTAYYANAGCAAVSKLSLPVPRSRARPRKPRVKAAEYGTPTLLNTSRPKSGPLTAGNGLCRRPRR